MRRQILLNSLFLVFNFLIAFQVKATHIVGGELNYRCLGNDEYELTLTVFRDCLNGIPDFDDPAHIGIFGIDNELVSTIAFQGVLDIPYVLDDTLSPTLFDPCLSIPPFACIDVSVYVDTISLPFRPGGYKIVYQRCCRNMTIVNIINPAGTGATYTIHITEEALNLCNSSAVFKEWPPNYICVNKPILFDHSALDADGDSLVYSLCTPFDGGEEVSCIPPNTQVPCFDALQPCGPIPCPPFNPPFANVVWNGLYNESDMLGGIPLAIDSETGFLTGTPNTIGQFVVGVCLNEYRNGVLISTSRRDFQYNIGICGETVASYYVPEIYCNGLEVYFDNESVDADSFEWYFNDPGNPDFISYEANPTYTFSDTGMYTVMLIANPGSLCVDTSTQDIFIQIHSLFAEFDYEFIGCTDSLIIQVSNLAYDTISTIETWEWELSSPTGVLFTSNEQNPTFILATSTTVFLNLTVTAENGCVQTLGQTFPANIFSSDIIPDELINCQGDSTELNPDPPAGATYVWSPVDGLSDPNAANPLASPDMTTIYTVFVTNQFGCELYDTVQVTVIDDIPFVDAFADPDTINIGQTSQLEATEDGEYSYEWSNPETLDDPSIFNPLATLEETTEYTVTITDANGCTNTAIVRVVVLDPECIEPNIFLPNAFTPNNDGENDVLRLLGRGIDEMYLAIYNRWGQKVFESNDLAIGWDGTFKGEALAPDVYGFYLRVRCFNGDDFFKKGNIALLK